jgi:DUF4097 and DUF4098 domain-containing protein YvlB
MRALSTAPLLAAGLLILTGCEDWGDWGPSNRYKEDFHHSYPLKSGGTVSVENFNGPVEIMSWEQDTVEVNGTKYASQRSYLDDMRIDISATSGAVRIRTLRPSMSHGNCGASYSIRVPKRVMLDEIVSSNGGIRIDRGEGTTRVRTSNGSVRIDGLKGDLNARTSNGSIELRDLDGNARVHTSNGHIDAETTHGSFEAETSNSRIEATVLDPAPDWPIRLHSSNGHIELTLRGGKLPDLRAETSNSSIILHLPSSVNARVRATTSRHSSITTDFDELFHGDEDDRRGRRSEVDGRIGSGGPLIDLSTSNGPIKILKQ